MSGPQEQMRGVTGGQIVVQALRDLGAQIIFSVSGNQILPIYDAAKACGLRIVHMRHESAAAYAAAAAAEISNQPGVVLVSAGPAFVSALAGVVTARSMEVPLLFLSGASATREAKAGAFQDFDQTGAARTVCKMSFEVATVEGIRPALRRAWQLAQAGIPGPVHISLPADVLLTSFVEQVSSQEQRTVPSPLPVTDTTVLQSIAARLTQAQRPLLIARPSAARGDAGKALWNIARHLHIEPIITECPRGLRDLKYREVIRHYAESDAALVIAPADFTVGFLARSTFASEGRVFLIDAPGDPPPRRQPDLHIQTSPALALAYLKECLMGPATTSDTWTDLWSRVPLNETITAFAPGEAMHPLEVSVQLCRVLRPDDVIILDGGEFAQWMRLGLRDLPNRVLWNSRFGGIGGSIAMALGVAATGHPGRTIVLLGDGAAGYHLSEFETAARYGLPFLAIIGNDARWAAEWFQQVKHYGPDRAFETMLSPAQYDMVAIGLGAAGASVADPPALSRALALYLPLQQPICLNVHIRSLCSPAAEE